MTPMTDEQLAAHRALAQSGEVSDRDGAVMLQLLDYIDVLRNRAVAVAALEDIRQLIAGRLRVQHGNAIEAVKALLDEHQKLADTGDRLLAENARLKERKPVAATDYGAQRADTYAQHAFGRAVDAMGYQAARAAYGGAYHALLRLLDERIRQHAKWGEQNHPVKEPHQKAYYYGVIDSESARASCQRAVSDGTVTWADILVEEVAEFLDADTPEDQAREIEKVGAQVVQIREYLERVKKGGE